MPSKPPLKKKVVSIHQLLCIFLASELSLVSGYSHGAPVSMCDSMTPHHDTAKPQDSNPPFKISLSSTTAEIGGNITVTLNANTGYHFRGFLLKAVPANGAQNGAVGSFLLDNLAEQVYQPLACSGADNSALTHTSNADKRTIKTTWRAPFLPGTYDFLATVVYNKSTFWTSFKSAESVSVAATGARFPVAAASPPMTPVPAPTRPPFVYDYPECGTMKSCMGYPSGCISTANCLILLALEAVPDGTAVSFEMVTKVPADSYVAMALSTDKNMGDDSVIECFGTPNGQMAASINNGRENIKAAANSHHFTIKRVAYEDGILHCNFSRPIETAVAGIVTNMKNNEYHLLIASGPLNRDKTDIAYHSHKMYSTEKIDLSSAEHIIILGGDSLPVPIEIIIHGSFMVVAWIGTASIAIFLARYYKDMWPEKTHCNVKIWFAWHRGLNMVTVLLASAAFILIFVSTGITPLWKSSYNIHPILGTIAVVLMILQPVGALFRPDPGSPRRPIFNWLHYLGGMLASICAVITIFFAVTLKVAQLPTYFWWILIAYVAFYVVLFCVMEFFTCLSSRKAEKEIIPMKDYSGHDGSFHIINQTEPQGARFKEVMLMLFSVGVLGFTAALVAVIAT